MLYPVLYALIIWIFRADVAFKDDGDIAYNFTHFSQTYVTLGIFAIQVFITMKRDLSIFIKLMSFGSYFIMALMAFLIGTGFYGFATNSY